MRSRQRSASWRANFIRTSIREISPPKENLKRSTKHMKFYPMPTNANATTNWDRTGKRAKSLGHRRAGNPRRAEREISAIFSVLVGEAVDSAIFLRVCSVAGAALAAALGLPCVDRMPKQRLR